MGWLDGQVAVLPVHCDVTSEADVAAMFDAALKEFGRVDAVAAILVSDRASFVTGAIIPVDGAGRPSWQKGRVH
jgi:NAD(P)-dependent dehydrogenase (short-subunit alcohol dehydrogenase family)